MPSIGMNIRTVIYPPDEKPRQNRVINREHSAMLDIENEAPFKNETAPKHPLSSIEKYHLERYIAHRVR